MRRRGFFLYTLFFTIYFTLFVFLALNYSAYLQRQEASRLNQALFDKVGGVQDDVGSDLLKMLDINRLSLVRNSDGSVNISIDQVLPSVFSNDSGAVQNYSSFVQSFYSNRINLNGSLYINMSAFNTSPHIIFSNSTEFIVNYSYNNFTKNIINITIVQDKPGVGVRLASQVSYAFNFRANSAITFDTCGWSAFNGVGGVHVQPIRFLFDSATNTSCRDLSDNVNGEAVNVFWANYTGGRFINITIGNISTSKYSSNLTGFLSSMNLTANISVIPFYSNAPFTAYTLVSLNFTNQSEYLSSITLKQT